MDKLFDKLRFVLYWISVSSMTLMLGLIFFQVVSRYFFGHTFEWSEELARFLFVWVVFLGSALIMGESGHLAVQILPNKFKGTGIGVVIEILINLCSYAFTLLLLIQGAKMTSVMTFQIAPGLGISMSVVYSIIPISASLMMLYLFKDTVRIVKEISARKN
ncbi:TRAP-type C4-dicarboxylate transport system, small permease component [Maridesulfovibrio ferrireducens]|uniref:TRAP-type C4-dicarboxylate transport system, small permease component n=1 Tax=Maridesulfovibrio ferrireducens TaxID=246191 RepID=A0A1G9FR10_9BACT|nr:TRAP transporter small permease [Maridesulfovibrio ferrireducens]SDK90856.1 TRAP-type C4-dicarboxylate transport system, small permease component [Maridesulfovibrio ferrireducens]